MHVSGACMQVSGACILLVAACMHACQGSIRPWNACQWSMHASECSIHPCHPRVLGFRVSVGACKSVQHVFSSQACAARGAPSPSRSLLTLLAHTRSLALSLSLSLFHSPPLSTLSRRLWGR